MLVAIRKRSWEEHVTHPPGLKYSYDDLDLVCSHGVDSDGVWIGPGALKQGRRTRCASVPEGCSLSTEDVGQIRFGAASLVDDVIESEHRMVTEHNEKRSLDLQDSSHSSEPQHPPTVSIVLCCHPNKRISSANISCTTDPLKRVEETLHYENDIDSERSQSAICSDKVVFKSPQISREEQQYIPISSNKESPLCEFAGEQLGDLPNHQETKESHAESYSTSPGIAAALNHFSAAGLEPQADCPDVAEGFVFILDPAGTKAPVFVQQDSANRMERDNAMPLPGISIQPVGTVLSNGEHCKELTECLSTAFANKLDGQNGLETLNETAGGNHCSRTVQGEQDHHAVVLDQGNDCAIFSQTLLEQHHVDMTAGNWPHGEESAQGESDEGETCVWMKPTDMMDSRVKHPCGSLTAHQSVSSERLNSGCSEEDHIQANTIQCADNRGRTYLSKSTENIDKLKELTVSEEPAICCPPDNSPSKLETIPENSVTLLKPLNSTNDVVQNPVHVIHLTAKHKTTGEPTENLPPGFKEEGFHGNQTSGCCFSESPVSEVADGHREHHRPQAQASAMEEVDETKSSSACSDTQLSCLGFSGTSEPGVQKDDDDVVKVRMRKVSSNTKKM